MRAVVQTSVTRPSVRRRLVAVAAVPLLVVAVGCTDGDEPAEEPTTTPGTTEDTSPTTEPPEPTAEPSSEPTEPEPTETPEPTDEPTDEPTGQPPPDPVGFRGALMPPASLPTPGDAPAWSVERTTGGEGGNLQSVCQKTELASLGATRTVTRQYTSGELSATHLVARFGDDVSAGRTYEVLQTWLSECGAQLEQQDLRPGRIPPGYAGVPGVGDRAGWAWLAYGPVPGEADASDIEVQALVHAGDTLSWVIWRQVGQDYNYPAGQTPPEIALPLMADRLP